MSYRLHPSGDLADQEAMAGDDQAAYIESVLPQVVYDDTAPPNPSVAAILAAYPGWPDDLTPAEPDPPPPPWPDNNNGEEA
jgi:hypothetical protein